LLGFDAGTVIYRATGCPTCGQSGFQGRIGVFEAIKIDDTVRRYITNGGDEAIIARHVFANSPNLAAAARRLVSEGQTTAEEAVRIMRAEATGDA
jgi:general secretion pathway protein E